MSISAGADGNVLQTLMGHQTATLTLDRYGQLFPDDLVGVADAFDRCCGSTADGPSPRAAPAGGNTH